MDCLKILSVLDANTDSGYNRININLLKVNHGTMERNGTSVEQRWEQGGQDQGQNGTGKASDTSWPEESSVLSMKQVCQIMRNTYGQKNIRALTQ